MSHLLNGTLINGGLVILFVILCYVFLKRKCAYWKHQNIESIEGYLVFGNFFKFMIKHQQFYLVFDEIYRKIKGPLGGFYYFTVPSLLVRDPLLIKQILLKDFHIFNDRGLYINEINEPLTRNLFALKNERWHFWRSKLTPLFTSGKLKQMTPTIASIGLRLQNHLERTSKSENYVVELRDLMSRYTTDVICSVAFGIDIDSINNPEELFRMIGDRIVRPSWFMFSSNIMSLFAPKFLKIFKIRTTCKKVEQFMRKIIEDTIDLRESKKVVRHDFMQLLIQLRNSGVVNEDGNWFTNIVKGKNVRIKTFGMFYIQFDVQNYFVCRKRKNFNNR